MNDEKPCWHCNGKREIRVLRLLPDKRAAEGLSLIVRCPECGDPNQPDRPDEGAGQVQREFWNNLEARAEASVERFVGGHDPLCPWLHPTYSECTCGEHKRLDAPFAGRAYAPPQSRLEAIDRIVANPDDRPGIEPHRAIGEALKDAGGQPLSPIDREVPAYLPDGKTPNPAHITYTRPSKFA